MCFVQKSEVAVYDMRRAFCPAPSGEMNHLLTLKLDMNRLLDLPDTLGGLSSLTELFLFENMIDVRGHCRGSHFVTSDSVCTPVLCRTFSLLAC